MRTRVLHWVLGGTFLLAACERPPVTSPVQTLVQKDVSASANCNTGDCEAASASITTEDTALDPIPVSPNPAHPDAAFSTAASASIAAFANPDAAYVAATMLIDISGISNFTVVGSTTDGLQTVTFSTGMSKRQAEVSGWATWGDPPFTEVLSPHVLWTRGATSLTMTLSLPTPTFGFELEPSPFATITFTADFFSNGGTVLEGSITRSVAGFHGARLFAATSTGAPIDEVVVSGGSDFAIGRLRYTRTIEVDIDIKPGSDPNSINCTNDEGVMAVAILTTGDFDATTVDHTTVTFEGASETHVDKKTGVPRRHEQDVDGDGDADLVFHFRLGDTGLTCASTEGTLRGETFDGTLFEGNDAVRMIGGSRLSFSFADPVGDHLQLRPVRQLNPPAGVIDVVGLHFTFDSTTGDYEIILTASAANPFAGGFRVNVLLFNPDTGTTAQDPAFFIDSINDFFLTTPSTVITLMGTDPKLLSWEAGDRVAACEGASFAEFGPCLGGLGLPDGIAGFGTGVLTFTTPPPFGLAKGLDVFFTAPPATISN